MKRIWCISLFLAMATALFAGEHRFNSLTVENGLSNNTVSAIRQDALGRIWMATRGGVNRFDGNDVKWYQHSPDDEHTIQSNFVNTVFADKEGNIWACSADGLSRYNQTLDRFERMETEGIQSIEGMVQLSDTHFLLATRDHSVIFDSESGKTTQALLGGKDIVVYGNAEFNGVILLGTSKRSIEFVTYSPSDGLVSIRDRIKLPARATAMHNSRNGRVWVGLNEGQLFLYEGNGMMFEIKVPDLPSIRIEALEEDPDGKLWIGTKLGVYIYSPVDGSTEMLTSDNFDAHSISSNAVRSIIRDSRGNMWVGSTYGGISCRPLRKSAFRTIDSHTLPQGLSGDIVRSVAVDADGNVWAGTRYNGINCCNLSDGHIISAKGMDQVLSIYFPQKEKNLAYAGTYTSGIIEVDKTSGKQRQISPKIDVNDMIAANGGKVWVASLGGLYLFDPSDGSLTSVYGKDPMVRAMDLMKDSQGRLWIGAKECIKVFSVAKNNSIKDETPSELKDIVRVQNMYEAPDGTIWICTSDGLMSYKESVLERVPESSGLRSVPVDGVISDEDGLLWVITDNGLCRYNPQKKEGRFYYTEDGLPGNQYSSGSICKDDKGMVYVGSTRGLSYFNTKEVTDNDRAVDPFISEIWINNRQVRPEDGTRVLSQDITLTRSIVLSHKQNAILLRFACPDYASWGQVHYKYTLQGFDHGWKTAEGRDATYTNLPAGYYTFKVKCSNSDGVWAEGEDTLRIRVKPAWYRTLVAELIFILLALIALAYAVFYVIHAARLRNEAKMADLQRQYEVNIRQARLRSYVKEGTHLNAQAETFLSTVLKHIEENISNADYSVEALASAMCMSRSNLHIKVKEITGLSPIELIKKMRIEKACELIRKGDIPLKEVASRSGFASLSYFSVAFKKAMEMTPGEYAYKSGRKSGKH